MVPENLLEKNLAELRAMAQALGVKNVGKYRKSELIEMVSGRSEAPAPKKRGRPTKGTAPRKAAEEQKAEPAAEAKAPAPEQPASKPAKGWEDRRKQPAKKPAAPEEKAAPAAEKPGEDKPAIVAPVGEKPADAAPAQEKPEAPAAPAQETARAEGREEVAERGEQRRRNDRYQNNRNQKGYTRHFSSYNPERHYSERTGQSQNQGGQYQNQSAGEQKAPNRFAAPTTPPPAAGEEEKPYYNQEYGTFNPAVPRMLETENCPPTEGVLEVLPDGYGFLRMNNYYSGPKDIYLSITQIRRFNLKTGDYVEGRARPHREGDKFDALMYIDRVNGLLPDENARRKSFEELVPIFPNERYTLETAGESNSLSARLIDLIAPIGKGQRAMIVSQPKAGKTTLLKQIAAGISANYPDSHLMVLLIDERPEEVTEMKRCIQGEVIYSTFDELPEHHTRIAEMVQERAMRLVEQGKDVVILLDSLTRLTRAYNLVIPPTGRTLSGGMDPGALHRPKRFFGAARNIEGGGSLTVIATALVETGSRMDDIVYEEFKGTGNMEIHLDRKLAEKRVFPAIDIYKSGTRREELLLSKAELEGVYMLRKFLAGGGTTDVTEQVVPMMAKTATNEDFLAKLKDWIRIYEKSGYTLSSQNRYGN